GPGRGGGSCGGASVLCVSAGWVGGGGAGGSAGRRRCISRTISAPTAATATMPATPSTIGSRLRFADGGGAGETACGAVSGTGGGAARRDGWTDGRDCDIGRVLVRTGRGPGGVGGRHRPARMRGASGFLLLAPGDVGPLAELAAGEAPGGRCPGGLVAGRRSPGGLSPLVDGGLLDGGDLRSLAGGLVRGSGRHSPGAA